MSQVNILEPREVPLGGLRAMNVRRTLPQRGRTFVGAWCFLDHYGPDDVAESGGMDVPAHPHTGLQTVSWLFAGEIEHRDSAGHHALVKPGEMNLMTAGSGISHSERSTPGTTVLHGAQLWIALPEHARNTTKSFEHYAPPMLNGEGWRGQVFLGELLGNVSPVKTFSPLVGAEFMLEPGASLKLDVDQTFEHGLLVDAGSVTLQGDPVSKEELAIVDAGPETLEIVAGDEGARILFIGGEPFEEEIIMWWNFIGRSHEEIVQYRNDWQAEIKHTGVGDPSDPEGDPNLGVTGRYGLPDDEPEPPLPAPKIPIARLKLRG